MPYIGMFTEDKIQLAINQAAENLEAGKTRVVLHGGEGEAYVSLVKKLGDHVSVEAAVILDTSDGIHFDKEHLDYGFQIVGEF